MFSWHYLLHFIFYILCMLNDYIWEIYVVSFGNIFYCSFIFIFYLMCVGKTSALNRSYSICFYFQKQEENSQCLYKNKIPSFSWMLKISFQSWKTSTHSLIQLSELDVTLLWCELCFFFYLICHSSVWLFYVFNFLFEIIHFNLHLTFKSYKIANKTRRNSTCLCSRTCLVSLVSLALESLNKTLILKELFKSTRLWNKVICSTHTLQHYGLW